MYYFSQVQINSIGSYIEEVIRMKYICDSSKEYFQWYRGHADASWELLPKIQRGFNGADEELFRKERFYTNDFQARASIFKSPKPKLNEYANWLTLMQHYGLPTRLLDWSRSPLVALYFAVSEETEIEKDACVWVLTPGKLNELERLEKSSQVDDKEYDNTFIYNMEHKTVSTMIYTAFKRWELSDNKKAITPEDKKFDYRFKTLRDKIVACYPTESDSRVYNQLAAFTVHNSTRKLEDICNDKTLMKIIIPHEFKQTLLYELRVCGITDSYIYPDLEHLAKELKSFID